MKQKETPTKTIGKYFRDFSIVVAGIAVTLYVNYQVTHQSEKRDLKLYLNAIKLELAGNIYYLGEERERLLSKEFEYADYLKSHAKNELHQDTIRYYAKDGYVHAEVIAFKAAAFEMFKSSGAMRLMQDKELMQKIWEAYFLMHRHEITLDKLEQMKMEEIRKWLDERKENPDVIPLHYFYTSGIYDSYLDGKLNIFEEISELLKEILPELEKASGKNTK